ncbi:MAG: flippase [Sulfurovum sp.]|nr:MAG: flippase [Sulfurovum sp.]
MKIEALNKIANSDVKRLFANFISLLVLQGANYILPLLILPYLIRTIGVENFGILSFAEATITYFMIITDYGFNSTATRWISVHRDNKQKVTEIFSAVLTAKFLLMFLSAIILTILLFISDRFYEHKEVYIFTFGMVIGQVLFPTWFFQGYEKMKYIAYLNTILKILSTVSIFIFVTEQSDFYIVPILNALGTIIAGIWSFFIIKKDFGISFCFQSIEKVIFYFKDGWHLFLSTIAVVMYTSTNIVILGVISSDHSLVGHYSIAEKIIMITAAFGSLIDRAIFPHFSKIWINSQHEYYQKFNNILILLISIMSIFTIFLHFFNDFIMLLIAGEKIEISSDILAILAFAIIFMPLGSLYSNSFVIQEKNIYVTKVTIMTMIFNLLLVPLLTWKYSVYGMAYGVVLVNMFHIFLNVFYFNRIKSKDF